MRTGTHENGITIKAIAGTRTVFLGLDLAEAMHDGCLGFAIQRQDESTREVLWLQGKKTFAETDPGIGPGATVPTEDHPIQNFWWVDLDAEPEHNDTYTVVPRYGTPTTLTSGPSASVTVVTEAESGDPHSVFFNRGAVASQEYVRDFGDVLPRNLQGDLQEAAYRFLSHGLSEALQAFPGPRRWAGLVAAWSRVRVQLAARARGARRCSQARSGRIHHLSRDRPGREPG